MFLHKILILFFGLPALFCRASFLAPVPKAKRFGIAHLYCRCKAQPQVCRCSLFAKYIAVICCLFLSTQQANAQVDSNYVDTTSMRHIQAPLSSPDTVIIKDDTSGYGYNDQDDGYVDTSEKHIYDTSQYFFNWKDYYNDAFTKEKITQRHLIDAEVNALKKEEDFWYIPAIEKLETRLKNDSKFRDSLLKARKRELIDERQEGIFYQPWFNTLLWIIIIGVFAAAVIYFLVQNKISIFSKEATSSAGEVNDEEENIFSLSYTKLIQNAEKEKDYRVAIRLMFLQTLKLLSDINAIQYQPDYTDLHYLQQLQQSKYYDAFFSVMHSYEYAWYGKFFISPERYATIRNEFMKLQNRIR